MFNLSKRCYPQTLKRMRTFCSYFSSMPHSPFWKWTWSSINLWAYRHMSILSIHRHRKGFVEYGFWSNIPYQSTSKFFKPSSYDQTPRMVWGVPRFELYFVWLITFLVQPWLITIVLSFMKNLNARFSAFDASAQSNCKGPLTYITSITMIRISNP